MPQEKIIISVFSRFDREIVLVLSVLFKNDEQAFFEKKNEEGEA
jgi:hypothetical protein